MDKSLVLGFFDGIHKAHRAVINSAKQYSNNITVVTLKDSPSLYFNNKVEYIFSRKNSIEKVKSLGVKEVVEFDFSEVAKTSAHDYLRMLIDKYHPVSISSGFNHTFGFNKQGNPELLKEMSGVYNYKFECVNPIVENGEVVSSSLIKNYLKQGNVEYANFLLESKFILEGTVIHGAKLGRTIGYPTANIKYPDNIIKLPYGVYCATYDGKKSVVNWGMKPTVNNTLEPVIEVHILNFDGDLYDKNIKIELIKQIRNEQKFSSLQELKKQIEKDIEVCLKL